MTINSYYLNRNSFKTALFTRLMDYVGDDKARENRSIVRGLRKGEWQEAAFYTAVMCDRMGFLLEHDAKLEKKFLAMNGDWIADVWLKVYDVIMKRRANDSPRYAMFFQALAKRALSDFSEAEIEVLQKRNPNWVIRSKNDIFQSDSPSVKAFP